MRLTLSTAKPLLARFAIQGACESDPRVLEKINEARERLMKMPQNWKGKVQRFLFCSANSCITLPREIETVEAATVCNRPMKMRGPWYDVLESGPGSGNMCGGDNVVDRGDGYVSFVDLDEPRNIKVYTDVPEASGARILLQGFDENGNRVRTFDSVTNAYVDGEYVGLNNATPQVSTTVFSTLDGIVKPETNGFIRLYAFTEGSSEVIGTDSTTVSNWAGPVPASGTLQWTGDPATATWTGTAQNVDIVLATAVFGPDTFAVTAYDTEGDLLAGFVLDQALFIYDNLPVVSEFLGPPGSPISGPFIPDVAAITWKVDATPLCFIYFEGSGVNGQGNLSLYDSTMNLIVSDAVVIPPGTQNYTWVPTETPGQPITSISFSTSNDLSDLFSGSDTFAYRIRQTETEGALRLVTDNTDALSWNFDIIIPDVVRLDMWDGQSYTFRITRVVTPNIPLTPAYLALMAIYHPDETNPSYRRYEIPQLRAGGSSCCGGSGESEDATPKQVVVMAKLRYLPVKRATDFLVIEHIGALKMMLLALNFEEKGEFTVAGQYEAKAAEILAQEIQNHIGDSATANQPMQVQQDAWAASTIPNIL